VKYFGTIIEVDKLENQFQITVKPIYHNSSTQDYERSELSPTHSDKSHTHTHTLSLSLSLQN